MPDQIIDVDLQADGTGVDRAKLLQFGWRPFGSEAAMNATTTGNTAGEIAYVTASGCIAYWDAVNNKWRKLIDQQVNNVKAAVRAAELAVDVPIAAPGATIDGVAMVAGDRLLIGGNTDPIENGIYLWNGAAVPMTRVTDLDGGSEADAAVVAVEEGTANQDKLMMQTADDVTVGTDAQAWSTIGPSAGVTSATTTVEGVVRLATAAEIVANAALSVPTVTDVDTMIDNRGGSFLFGDAAAQTFTVAHGIVGLAGHQLVVQITRESDDARVGADVTNDDTNIVINTLTTPALNGYRCTYWFAG